MNTFSDRPVSCKCLRNGGGFAMDGMVGLQQSFAGAVSLVA
jgi:hypothetical protein